MLEVTNLGLAFGQQQVLNGVNFRLNRGEIGCVLGPSGCGKTSLMRSIAGFNQIDAGQIDIAGNTVATSTSCLPVATRKVGVVFQDFALFPHFTVVQNVAYGLDHLLPDERDSTAKTFIDLVGLSEHSGKLPHQLSGGQQQRVAIARALAPKPDLLLLDEPFSSLDPELRSSIAQEVRHIIKQNGTTALLITHDQNEAFTMADKIGVLHKGICEQWSDAHTLYHQPNTEFVARFVGEGTFILGDVELDNEATLVSSQLGKFSIPSNQAFGAHQTVKLLVRPDDIIHDDSSPFKAIVVSREFRGANILYTLKLKNHAEQVMCLAPSHHDHMPDESFGIRLDLNHVICFEHV